MRARKIKLPGAFSAEIGLYPRFLALQHVVDGAFDQHFLLAEHGHPVASGEQRVEVMRHHVDGQIHRIAQLDHQLVELRRADRIETRCRLVEEDDVGIERQRPRQCGALDHAAGQFGWEFLRRVGRQPDQLDLEHRQFVHQLSRQVEIFAHRHLDVFQHRQRREQGAVLEQHAKPHVDAQTLGIISLLDIDAEQLDGARLLARQAENGAQ